VETLSILPEREMADNAGFPEFRHKLPIAPIGRLSMHHALGIIPSCIKASFPKISSVDESGMLGFSEGDAFFSGGIKYERLLCINRKWMSGVLRW
jgi:hypothetical protein